MKKVFILFLILTTFITGCKANINGYAKKFQTEYESVNGQANASGRIHRSVSINEENPFVYITVDDLIKKHENNESYYVYFGSKLCPWCRSMIEKTIEVANKNNIKTIYYIDIWDDEGHEILRDRYIYEDDKLKLDIKGTDNYYKLLELYHDVLEDYTITDDDNEIHDVGEKRIFAPYLIYVENGKAKKSTDGISTKQEDSHAELTEDMLKDEEEKLEDFFNN